MFMLRSVWFLELAYIQHDNVLTLHGHEQQPMFYARIYIMKRFKTFPLSHNDGTYDNGFLRKYIFDHEDTCFNSLPS